MVSQNPRFGGEAVRKKFVLYALVPALILLAVVYLFIDSWIESGIETAGEAMTGAKVEIDKLSVSISPLGLRWARLQAADPREPMKNIVETGTVQVALNAGQVLRGKYIVETMEINNLIFGTKRTTSGELPKEPAPERETGSSGPGIFSPLTEQASAVIASAKKQTPNFDLATIKKNLNVDSLLNPRNLRSYRMVDSLKAQVNQASIQWQTTLTEIDKSKQRLSDIETNVKSININELKSIDQITTTINTVKNTLNTANEVKQTFTERQKVITESVNTFAGSARSIDNIARQDFEMVVNMARLPDVSMKGLAEIVLGKELMASANSYLYWVDFARKNIPFAKTDEKDPSPPRMKGQTIRFPEERSYPKFWIKKMLLSGGTDAKQDPEFFYAKGEILNISDNQRITGQPITAGLTITKSGSTNLALNAMFDRRKDESLDTYKAMVTGVKVASMEIGRADFLPSKITNATAEASIDVAVPGKKFESTTGIQFANLAFSFDTEPKNVVEKIVRDVLQSITGFRVNLRMWNAGDKFDVAFATDLDDQITSRTKKVVGDEIARIQNDLRNQLNRRIAEKRKEFENLYNQKREEVMARLKTYEGLVNEKLAMVENKKKELENKVEEEKKKQTDALKKKGEDLLKGILKKK